MDTRIEKLADILVNYSCRVKNNEKVMVDCHGASPYPFVKAIIKEVYKARAIPFYALKETSISREIIKNCNDAQLRFMADIDLPEIKGMDAYIGIRAYDNINELSDLPMEKISQYLKGYSEIITDWRVENTKWVVLRYPNNSMAQLANTSLEDFEDFYFNVCNLDYRKMSKAMDYLVRYMEKTDHVSIKGPGTDLGFSIKGIPVIKCDGQNNIPDGEVFTAPVRESVNGIISFNIPQVEHGVTYENIKYVFKSGKIIEATSTNEEEKLNKFLDTDEGSRYTGEFAIGLNPYVTKPMKDALFDEKIAGSFHLTPGKCYDKASNGNKSAIHWDMICVQTPEYGGGEIYFDNVLVRKDGLFVLPELECLNPVNLK